MKVKYNVTLFYFGKFETQLHSELTKKAFFGVWSKPFLPALKNTVACCRFLKIKLYSTHEYLPTEDTTGLKQRLEELRLGINIVILTLTQSFS